MGLVLGVTKFSLKCSTHNSNQILTEIWACFDLSLKPMECAHESDTCSKPEIYAYPLVMSSSATAWIMKKIT